MVWTVIISLMICMIALLLIKQYIHLSRLFYFDKAIADLRELQHDAVITLSAEVINSNQDQKYLLELRKLVGSLDATIANFDLLKPRLFRFKTFKKIFLNIDFSLQKAENIDKVATYGEKLIHIISTYQRIERKTHDNTTLMC